MTDTFHKLDIRPATVADLPEIAAMNRELIIDEGHRNPMTLSQLEERARGFMESGEWHIDLLDIDGRTAGFATWREQHDITEKSGESVYLRQFYISRDMRGGGVGRKAFDTLVSDRFPANIRVVLEVMQSNPGGQAFWSRMGFVPYASTLERRCDESHNNFKTSSE
ncbi:GNAT family N-acetyltransferase [Rhizobium sp. L1K21]|uniref:GNAT family N-acetyltransferase n=1 Tax=Rhizobium sp. L1K21 TaxID=2954933 RepID=UPI0020932AD0|nr:GNAT family N-acetyltransferase [Rhizobium sp. L1K21]MCO6187612.1 GNAT family N-acetyltransferase [Rhizobium sp. L1K21]